MITKLRFILATAITISSGCVSAEPTDCPRWFTARLNDLDNITVDGKILSEPELYALASDWRLGCPQTSVVLMVSPEATSRFLVDVVNGLRDQGIEDVAVSTDLE